MSQEPRRPIIPFEKTVIIDPIDFDEIESNFVAWALLRKQWPRKSQLLLKFNEIARREYVDTCLRPTELAPVELIFDTMRGFASEMGRRLVEWVAVDGQQCTNDLMAATRSDIHAIFNHVRRYWLYRLPPEIPLEVRHEYQRRLEELATVGSRECLDQLQIKAAISAARQESGT